MKKSIIIYFLFFISNSILGQSFVNENNAWTISDCYWNGVATICTSNNYWFGNEVTIDNKEYFELMSDKSEADVNNTKYYRESNGIVFVKENAIDEEIAIYNFDLEVGEIFEMGNSTYSLIVEAKSIDTITLNSGKKIKRMGIALNQSNQRYWYEGIGSEQAPLFPMRMYSLDTWESLNCFYENNSLELSLNSGNCGSTKIEVINEAKTLNIFPNPANGFLRLDIQNNECHSIEVIDLVGNKILSIHSDFQKPINIERLSSGIYVLKVRFKDNTIRVLKFEKL